MINYELLSDIKNIYKSSKEINEKFLKAFQNEKAFNTIKAELCFEEELYANANNGNLNAKILIYKITNNLKS